MAAVIEMDNVLVRYGHSEVLKGISFSIEKGDFIGLTGPNGAGKTTLIKAILGLLPIASGNINLFGKPHKTFMDTSKIGYLPQKVTTINHLFPATAEEVVLLGLLSKKKWPKKITMLDRTRVAEIFNTLRISDLRKRMFSELSGGQQQRVMLARSLVLNPEILIFDEPITALDAEFRESFFQLIEMLNKNNQITIVLIAHDTAYIGKYSNKLLYLDKNIIYYGRFSDFCKSEKMRQYFGEYGQHLICHQEH